MKSKKKKYVARKHIRDSARRSFLADKKSAIFEGGDDILTLLSYTHNYVKDCMTKSKRITIMLMRRILLSFISSFRSIDKIVNIC